MSLIKFRVNEQGILELEGLEATLPLDVVTDDDLLPITGQLSTLTNQLDTLSQSLSSTVIDVDAVESSIDAINQTINGINTQITSLNNGLSGLTSTTNTDRTNLNNLSATVTALNTSITNLNNSVTTVSSNVTTNTANIASLTSVVNSSVITAYRHNQDVASVANTAEQTLWELNIPADKYNNNSIFEIYVLFSVSSNSNAKTVRMYLNNTPFFVTNIPANQPKYWYERKMFLRNSKSSQLTVNINDGTHPGTSGGANSLFTIDLTNGLNFRFTSQMNVATDILTLQAGYFRISN